MTVNLGARVVAFLLLMVNAVVVLNLAAPSPSAAALVCGSSTNLDGLVGHAAPVILVHGWTGNPMSDTRAALETLPSHDGRQYLLFDYSKASTKWADDPEVAGCLAQFIKQVSDTHLDRGGDGMVYLVAHSMGGLAIRFALDPGYGGIAGLVDRVGGVVSLDTPYRGSMWGDSFAAWAKSALTDIGHGNLPHAAARAWHCLAVRPGLGFPPDCAAPPALDPSIPLFQVAGDVSLRRTLFGFEAYTMNMGGDAIVSSESERGSVGADGHLVATQVGFQDIPCTVVAGDLAVSLPVGFWAAVTLDDFLIDLYQGKHSGNDVRVLAVASSLLGMLFSGSCSHVGITRDPQAIKATDEQLTSMIRRQHGLTQSRELLNAPIPASCGHPAGRLRGTHLDWPLAADGHDQGFASLDIKNAVFGDVTGDGRSDAVAALLCSAGGVSWPELLLVYGPGTRLEGFYDLRDMENSQEHVDVRELTFAEGGAEVRLESYEGAGFDVATYTGRLTWSSGGPVLSYAGPLTIDFTTGQDPSLSDLGGFGYVRSPDDVAIWLSPAPDDFTQFIIEEWRGLDRISAGCPEPSTVRVDRYSHLGYAAGGEGSCGGARHIWSRSGGSWHTLVEYQDGPYCGSGDVELRRALTALGMGCIPEGGTTMQDLGHWPESGQ